MSAQVQTPIRNSNASTRTLVAQLKSTDTDYEWYPTTDEILAKVKDDFKDEHDAPSVLDCGAGDGRSLMYLTKGKRYAIEKSYPLLQALDSSVFIVGTEFQEQTLIDKSVDVIFCNPPYSEYTSWADKIIREGNCKTLYLVIPVRWADNPTILSAIERRKAKSKVIGSFDFTEAERSARARIDIVRIDLSYESRYSRQNDLRVDPFDLWFNEQFKLHINNEASSKYQWSERGKRAQQDKIQQALVKGRDIVSVLVELYFHELTQLMSNYKALEDLDPCILQELDVNLAGLKAALRQKVEGLKDRYWQELFNNLEKITSRLTTDARIKMLDKLTQHTHVDFTASNAHAILIWVIKNANSYFDSQLVMLVERMTEQACVLLYKSNRRVYTDEHWRYRQMPSDLNRYFLDYRIVLNRVGGLCISKWTHDQRQYNGLSQRAFELLADIRTVAANLGFTASMTNELTQISWESNKAVEFTYYDEIKKQTLTLMVARAFKNGNLHLKLNQSFICRLNVEFGRLKGWLKTPIDASDELSIDPTEVMASFGANLQLSGGDTALLSLATDVVSH